MLAVLVVECELNRMWLGAAVLGAAQEYMTMMAVQEHTVKPFTGDHWTECSSRHCRVRPHTITATANAPLKQLL